MVGKLEAFDATRLRQQLEQRQIRFQLQQSEYCWAYQLIARGARVVNQFDAYGWALLPEFRGWACPPCAIPSTGDSFYCPRRITNGTSRRRFCARR